MIDLPRMCNDPLISCSGVTFLEEETDDPRWETSILQGKLPGQARKASSVKDVVGKKYPQRKTRDGEGAGSRNLGGHTQVPRPEAFVISEINPCQSVMQFSASSSASRGPDAVIIV